MSVDRMLLRPSRMLDTATRLERSWLVISLVI